MSSIKSSFQQIFQKSKRLTLNNLLSKGYFPKELPPPFRTRDFANKITSLTELPTIFTKKSNTWTDYTKYSLARTGHLRRILGIINPLSYYRLAKLITDNQNTLFAKSNPEIFSLSHPVINPNSPRALTPQTPDSIKEFKITELRVGKKYCVKADVAQFYPSIYTHALDWAITGKTKAKADINNAKAKNRLGSKIDKMVSACQKGQTKGIPIGPDSSLLLSSIILARVDSLLRRNKSISGIRYMDDYELMLENEPQTEKAITSLENALAEYELTLNTRKTQIFKLPKPILNLVSSKLSNHGISISRFQSPNHQQSTQVIKFFDKSFYYADKHPKDPVLYYTIGILNNIWSNLEHKAKQVAINLVLQSITLEAGVLSKSIHILEKTNEENPSLLSDLHNILNIVIIANAPKHHSSEVAWALWISIKFNYSLPSKVVNEVSKMKDDVCSLLLLKSNNLELCDIEPVAINRLQKQFDNNLRGDHWLFTYTAIEKGWLPYENITALENDDLFMFLREHEITFFDESLLEESNTDDEDGDNSFFDYGMSLEEEEDDEYI